ncbi:hypothetical protein JT739_09790 [Tepidanaerobacter sp. GT38]|uniref:FGGY-family carbohydrate kinase n=1 Tax=Tepidanaerobacter sp. GT38 TaxID=2722793 RepID=UPI001EFF037F|nr:FGGY family carbohydrate kinase [Tepidanaerobacter sp. GT38]MCG1012880.1 hypothetical protein [Tepidanaerobacter sp. GT38]
MYFIGIDIGTTNCKLCLYDFPEFNLVFKYYFKTPKIITGDYSDFDINEIWLNIKKGLKIISTKVKNIGDIKNISIASVGEAGVLIDKKGGIIGPVITWYDPRTIIELKHICDVLGSDVIYGITGLPPHSNYSLNKILWIKSHYPSKFNSAFKWLCMAEYIAYKLTGEMKAEYSLASRTMVLDLTTKHWSEKILKDLKLDEDIFPNLIDSGAVVGNILKSVSEQINLSPHTTVSIAGHDHMCGSIAAGLTDENSILNSTGTTEGLLTLQNNPHLESQFFNYALSNGIHVISDYYTLFASLPCAGYSIDWYTRMFSMLNDELENFITRLYEKKSKLSLKKSKSIVFIPHLRGSGPPNRSINSRGLFYGLSEYTTKEELLVAVFEGLCYELKNLLYAFEKLLGYKYKQVRVIGSACKNPFWLQLKADILNREIVAYEIDEAVAKGAVILSAYKNGYLKHWKDLEAINAEQIKTFEPNYNLTVCYEDIFREIYIPFYEFKVNLEKKEME